MLYEIRNYHYDPDYFEEYKKWSREVAAPYFKSIWDVVGIWFKNDMPPIYGGSLSRDENEVPANMTWIIRWKDREHRDKAFELARASDEWQRVFSTVPGGSERYLRTETIFAEEC